MATIGNRGKEMAMMGKKLVKSRVLSNNSHEHANPVSATSSRRGIHSSMYDKNPEEYTQPAFVPDQVVNSTQSSKYWVPHPDTGVFVPGTVKSLQSTDKAGVNNEGEKSVMEEKVWFRPTSLEDLEKPHS